MRFIAIGILLAFPIAEIFLLIKLGQHYGWWLALYLAVMFVLGLRLIKDEKATISNKMMQSFNIENIASGVNPVKTMLGSARNLFAGVLLMIPGVITDVIGIILLLIPIKTAPDAPNFGNTHQSAPNPPFKRKRAANDDIIEGEFTEIKNEKDQLK